MFQAVVRLSCVAVHQRPSRCAAKDRIAQNSEAFVLTLDLAPVRVGRLEDIAQSALRVVDLRLEVVALADHRSVQLDAGADGKTQFIVGMTRGSPTR